MEPGDALPLRIGVLNDVRSMKGTKNAVKARSIGLHGVFIGLFL
jgi:hypothetical protein